MSTSAAGRIRVRNVYPFTDEDKAMLAAVDPRLDIVHEGSDSAEWVASLRDPEVEILIASWPPPDLGGMPRLRLLMTTNAGIDPIRELDPWRLGLTVANGSGLHAVHLAEYVLGAATFAFGRISARMADHAAHRWVTGSDRLDLTGRRLRGRTAAIVGYGSVGRETARLLAACGMRILALKADPSRRVDEGWTEAGTGDPDGSIPERVVGPNGLADIVAEADLVVLTAPATDRTQNMIDTRILAAMRPDAWLVNVGRGALVDEEALTEALGERRIGGAVLDVTAVEPLPADSPLWDAPDCLITAHISGTGDPDALYHQAAILFAENLRRYVLGEPLLNVTSGTAGY
jgi:phosphoglycerate dehydrogenase-like enzyme